MPTPESSTAPPRYVEYSMRPVASSFATKAFSLPVSEVANAPAVIGKSADPVDPAKYAFPDASTAIALPKSLPLPPK